MSDFLSPTWPAPARLRACTTLRHGGGVSPAPWDDFNLGLRCGDDTANALENRRRLRASFGLPNEPVWLRQVHGTTVLRVDESPATDADEPEADAAVTDRDCVVLAILTADCLPVLFCDEDGNEVAAAHAGWRGLAGGVLEATVAAMHADPEDLMAWLGPAAGPASYEIGEEVRAAFVDADAGRSTRQWPGRFFSHRRDGVTGRMATLAWLAPR